MNREHPGIVPLGLLCSVTVAAFAQFRRWGLGPVSPYVPPSQWVQLLSFLEVLFLVLSVFLLVGFRRSYLVRTHSSARPG
ncbi:MAG: hypothetical protein ACREDE_06850 [Thermoplasmata archaeon]